MTLRTGNNRSVHSSFEEQQKRLPIGSGGMLDQAQSAQHHAVTFELRLDVLLQYSLGSLVLALSRTENCGRRCFETPVTHLASFEIAFHGIRGGARPGRWIDDISVQDPFGHCWGVATHKEDVSPGERWQRARRRPQRVV